MRTYFKILQINSRVEIQDPRDKSVYQHDFVIQLDGVEYASKPDALNALTHFLNGAPSDDGEYTIIEVYCN